MTRPFTARYGGPCAADCGSGIRPGDEVRYVGDDLMHTRCADEEERPTTARPGPPVCPLCWTAHAGDCL